MSIELRRRLGEVPEDSWTSMTLPITGILSKAAREEPLSREEILSLLTLRDQEEQEMLSEVARRLRDRYFGNKIFLYGFIYFSTWCQNDCAFCHYRASNRRCERYRKTEDQIIESAIDLAESGVHLLDLTMAEDPFYYDKEDGFQPLFDLVRNIKSKTGLPIMISWGVMPDEAVEKLPEVEADWFACYQETHNLEMFRRLRLYQDYAHRMRVKYIARSMGMLIEEGILTGVGESFEDLADSMETMRQMGVHQARVMNFVPQRGTPMGHFGLPHPDRENRMIAILRLLFPHRLIPASLDVYGIDGLKGKLCAGANVVTSLIPPSSGLMGVAQGTLGIREGHRTAQAITPILEELGLRKAGLEDYVFWIKEEKRCLFKDEGRLEVQTERR